MTKLTIHASGAYAHLSIPVSKHHVLKVSLTKTEEASRNEET
jgi:hypothetical protein